MYKASRNGSHFLRRKVTAKDPWFFGESILIPLGDYLCSFGFFFRSAHCPRLWLTDREAARFLILHKTTENMDPPIAKYPLSLSQCNAIKVISWLQPRDFPAPRSNIRGKMQYCFEDLMLVGRISKAQKLRIGEDPLSPLAVFKEMLI